MPLAGATITAEGKHWEATTDESGRFSFPGAQPGSYTLEVSLLGYLPHQVKVAVVAGSSTETQITLTDDPAFSEVIVVVGSRSDRTAVTTPVPVDLFHRDDIITSGQSETNQVLQQLAPSFRANHQTVADGSDHVNPASMRGLGPDQVLVLVNGKRRHASALVHSTDTFGRGASGVDLNSIPTEAIERMEVLRDGASAQYGSDAIAGVVNVVLKEERGRFEAMARTGITAEGDGFEAQTGMSYGLPIGKRGVLQLTGEFLQRSPTNRAGTWTGSFYGEDLSYDETTARLAENNLTRDDVRMAIGQSGATVGMFMLNGRLPVESTALKDAEIYVFGGSTYRNGKAAGYYRRPESEERVDLNRYPNGFLPEIHSDIVDWSIGVGARAKRDAWKLDLSANHGGNIFLFTVMNSINASFGAAGAAAIGADDGGTTFAAGGQAFLLTSLNADAVRTIPLRSIKSLSLVMGSEVRLENFRIMAGERASWDQGPETYINEEGIELPKVPGAQVFPGYRPESELSEYRTSVGAYVGAESELNKRLLLDVGGRFEYYSDFGSNVTGKVASRVNIVEALALRAAVSTGFRAPNLHQIWFNTTSTQFESDPITGQQTPKQVLTANNRSEEAASFGIPPLTEETSLNLSAGFTLRPIPRLSFTADAYYIAIDDRVTLSSRFDRTVPGVDEILMDFPEIAQVEFFVNAADTETMGLDLVADYLIGVGEGTVEMTASANFTQSEVLRVNVPQSLADRLGTGDLDAVRRILFGPEAQNRLEDLLPKRKGSLSGRYVRGPMSALVRANYYGPSYFVGHAEDGSEDEHFGDKVLFDLDLGYRLPNGFLVSIGANNVFNTYPDEQQVEANRFFNQFRYRPDQFGMNGGFYYARLRYER